MTEAQVHDKRIELKYTLDAHLSCEVRRWAREHLGVDRHCNASLGDSYDVNTLYLDTPEMDLFHRTGEIGRAKHRIRRYGDDSTLWIETKRKKANVVRKNRSATSEDEVVRRLTDDSEPTLWCGDWFVSRIAERRLQPTVQVHYRRFARTSTLGGESLRLTIDSHLQASPANGWQVAASSDNANRTARIDTADIEILELKFLNQMPHLFKELLRTFAIPATGFSKYRAAVERSGLGCKGISDSLAGSLSDGICRGTSQCLTG
ncbi:VTC domain protein [Rubripirellula tenax]|uniref:VTC domain protein n=1 Tax=Rubripirellula tenax TaxID=2528015 RepID=A0A5C6ELL8_9BACT|nr:polyphosphate polymerase domain-containing protein [Rubripirellula tenax]TWU48516.1 VTC domain protein [Rubripirellula tenax]